MREIKFRAWNKETKTMIDLHAITPLALEPTLMQDGVFLPFHENLILEQFTGLKDKNGKEIYEGDKLRDKHGNLCIVRWDDFRMAWWITKWGTAHELQNSTQVKKSEIIGNIHENPELLEREDKNHANKTQ